MLNDIYSLEQEYMARHGHTYTLLKAQALPEYYNILQNAVQFGTEITDDLLGLKFPEGVDQ